MENIKAQTGQALKAAADKAVEGVDTIRTTVAQKADALGDVVRDRATQARDYGRDALDEVTYKVQERPWTTVAIAVAIGVGIGCLIKSNARR